MLHEKELPNPEITKAIAYTVEAQWSAVQKILSEWFDGTIIYSYNGIIINTWTFKRYSLKKKKKSLNLMFWG